MRMKSKSKKVIALLMVAVLAMGMTATSFAGKLTDGQRQKKENSISAKIEKLMQREDELYARGGDCTNESTDETNCLNCGKTDREYLKKLGVLSEKEISEYLDVTDKTEQLLDKTTKLFEKYEDASEKEKKAIENETDKIYEEINKIQNKISHLYDKVSDAEALISEAEYIKHIRGLGVLTVDEVSKYIKAQDKMREITKNIEKEFNFERELTKKEKKKLDAMYSEYDNAADGIKDIMEKIFSAENDAYIDSLSGLTSDEKAELKSISKRVSDLSKELEQLNK